MDLQCQRLVLAVLSADKQVDLVRCLDLVDGLDAIYDGGCVLELVLCLGDFEESFDRVLRFLGVWGLL